MHIHTKKWLMILLPLGNYLSDTGSGVSGELSESMDEEGMLKKLQKTFHIPAIRHTAFTGKPMKKVALCGGAEAFLSKLH